MKAILFENETNSSAKSQLCLLMGISKVAQKQELKTPHNHDNSNDDNDNNDDSYNILKSVVLAHK